MKKILHLKPFASFATPHLLSKIGAAFTALIMTAVAAPAAQAPPHNISAANLNVIQNDVGNTEASVTVTTSLSINDMRVRNGSNRGDYNLQVGDTGTNDLADGMVMVAL